MVPRFSHRAPSVDGICIIGPLASLLFAWQIAYLGEQLCNFTLELLQSASVSTNQPCVFSTIFWTSFVLHSFLIGCFYFLSELQHWGYLSILVVLNSFLTACRHFAFWIAFLGGIWCGGFFLFWCFVFGAACPPPPSCLILECSFLKFLVMHWFALLSAITVLKPIALWILLQISFPINVIWTRPCEHLRPNLEQYLSRGSCNWLAEEVLLYWAAETSHYY